MSELEHIRFYTTNEVAEILKISPASVRRLCKDNEIKNKRVGRREYRISETALKEYLGEAI